MNKGRQEGAQGPVTCWYRFIWGGPWSSLRSRPSPVLCQGAICGRFREASRPAEEPPFLQQRTQKHHHQTHERLWLRCGARS